MTRRALRRTAVTIVMLLRLAALLGALALMTGA